ncbi:MAG: NAD(P)-dependent oxidoreductase [Candidatus Zixiibacteriota bacterium]
MKTGFIGLGTMGSAMVERLMAEKTELAVWNRTPAKATRLGLVPVEFPTQLLAECEIVILNLFDSAAVSAVLTGNNGLLTGDCRGKTIIDTTTNHFKDVLAFHGLCHGKGAVYLEAPVLGSVVPASKGTLTIVVSGQVDAFIKVSPLLEKLGQHIFHLPEPGQATRMKLVNNLLLGTFMTSIAEAIVIGERAGIEKEKVLDILAVGAGNSGVLSAKRQKLLDEDFSVHFSAAAIYKDLHFLQDLSRELKRPLFTGSLAKEIFAMVAANDMDKLDFSVVYKILKEL